ncbi:MAG: M23 family metallopeptidase [Verrucomicrobiaceae bacterium]|nr:M23 family metallopeptidase [Verrucomicrobiaceae bacterium]
MPALCLAQLGLVLPTENMALLEKRPEGYFQYVDRTFEGEKSTPWEGGQFGFVRDPRRVGSRILFARFHEGLDVKPVKRDAKGDPLDEVRSIAAGRVEYVTAAANQSNYGRYIVIRHDFPGAGAFYSLYAHLRSAAVTAGQAVQAGQGIGIMGYTGSGIDQRRAHVHVELNLMLNSDFDAWHAAHYATPNHHGAFNGLNLIGVDLQALFLANWRDPALTLPAFIQSTEPAFRVQVPASAKMELLRRHPWLLGDREPRGKAWEIAFSRWGLPISVAAADRAVAAPVLSWVKDTGLPHYHMTRGLVTGTGAQGTLTVEGMRFVRLLSGIPEIPAVK